MHLTPPTNTRVTPQPWLQSRGTLSAPTTAGSGRASRAVSLWPFVQAALAAARSSPTRGKGSCCQRGRSWTTLSLWASRLNGPSRVAVHRPRPLRMERGSLACGRGGSRPGPICPLTLQASRRGAVVRGTRRAPCTAGVLASTPRGGCPAPATSTCGRGQGRR